MTTVVLTGANSGLGTATTAELLRRGADVVATVRSDEAEDELRRGLVAAGTPTWGLQVERLDVTDAAACHAVVERHHPDVVVNNAGAALLGAVADIDDDEARAQLDSLVIGPMRLGRLAVESGSCRRVVQVSSMVADGMVPFTGWYAAAKAALEAVSDVWRLELEARDVDVVVVECGAIDTGVWQHAGEQVTSGSDPSTAPARRRWSSLTEVLEPHFADPADVGRTIADAALDERPGAHLRTGFASSVPAWARLVPEPLRRAVVTRLLDLRPG